MVPALFSFLLLSTKHSLWPALAKLTVRCSGSQTPACVRLSPAWIQAGPGVSDSVGLRWKSPRTCTSPRSHTLPPPLSGPQTVRHRPDGIRESGSEIRLPALEGFPSQSSSDSVKRVFFPPAALRAGGGRGSGGASWAGAGRLPT